METTTVDWGYMGIMENKMETVPETLGALKVLRSKTRLSPWTGLRLLAGSGGLSN